MREIHGYAIDIEVGRVYGKRGAPVGSPDSSGYLQVDARKQGLGMLSAHRLVWQAAYGPIPVDKEINHIDGVKTNNRIANLELVTRQGNVLHAYRTGLKSNRGERHPSNKLNDDLVRQIRRLRNDDGRTVTSLAVEFGVTPQTISHVARRKTWAHVGD